MICPHCKKGLKIPEAVYLNCEQYHKNNVIVTDCCNKPVVVAPKVSFNVSIYEGTMEYDDWGNKII